MAGSQRSNTRERLSTMTGDEAITPQGNRSSAGCGLFFRQFRALVHKNALLKRRAWFQLLVEILVPGIIMLVIGAIKSYVDVDKFEAFVPAADVPVVPYEVFQDMASYPNVICHDNNLFYRCRCHVDDEVVSIPYTYSSNEGLTKTGQAMWGTSHATGMLLTTCYGILQGDLLCFKEEDVCTIVKFFHFMCNDSDFEGRDDIAPKLAQMPNVDEACEAGTSAEDLDAKDYLTLISNTTVLLGVPELRNFAIPEDEISEVCEALSFAVMSSNDGAGAKEAADFYDYARRAFPDTASHWVYYDTESEFTDIIGEDDYSRDPTDDRPAFSVGIVFTAGSPEWAYKIRANITKNDPSNPDGYRETNTPDTNFDTENNCKAPDVCPPADDGRDSVPWTKAYHQAGVLMFQQLIDNWIMMQEDALPEPPPVVRVADFPNPQWQDSGFWSSAGFLFPFLVVIAVLYPVSNVISNLVKEKELRIKEGLKMMGLTDAAHIASWVFHFVALFFAISTLMMLLSGDLFENSDPVLVFLYFFLFFMASLSFCFLVSAFFSHAKTASTVGTLVFFVALFPYFTVSNDDTNLASRRAACLLPPTCLALGTLAFAEYEDSGEGVTTETADTSEDEFTFNTVLEMFIVDIVLFAVLAWYFGAVLQSEWGTAKTPWFIFTSSYWCPSHASKIALADSAELLQFESENRDSVEPVEEKLRALVAAGECVAIRGLTKEYKNSTGGFKLAVNKLDLTMYSGQITALLGHNGAGKTTTIGMLTGMIAVTSGTAFVAGRDVKDDMVNIRRCLGVCPQHDILYPDLTVREHLRMYAVLKGVPASRLQETISATLSDVGLTEKENEHTKTLSGGQKRKLSVGIAFIGGSKVIFLDEPTSGMDPHSRRFTWDLIRKHREGRIIILTTHFMDEADLLGDRVAIMADGVLRCCGSSFFLKKHYGVGYNLVIVLDIKGLESNIISPLYEHGMGNEKLDEAKDIGNTTKQEIVKSINDMVSSHVTEATLLSSVGAEVSFQLPNDASSAFQAMLTEIDARKSEFCISSYGMSATTLEEVFLRVADGATDIGDRKNLAHINVGRQSSPSSDPTKAETAQVEKSGGKVGLDIDRSKPPFWMHMMALLRKRLLTYKRDKRMWTFTVVMPAVFVLSGILMLQSVVTRSEPAVLLTPTVYNDGSATFPYAMECTMSDECDPGALMKYTDFPQMVEPILLDLADTANASDAIELMNAVLLEQDFGDLVYGAITFRKANPTTGISDYTVHTNYSGIHSGPLYVNQMNTATLRLLSGNEALSISTTIHPLPLTHYQVISAEEISSFSVMLFILIAFSFIPAAWITYIVREKETKCKHQQVVSGVGLNAFWISSYVWDVASLIPSAAFTIIVLAIVNIGDLIHGEAAGATILLFVLFGFSMPSYTYLWSFLFKSYSTAQNIFLFHNWITGLIAPIAISIMCFFDNLRGLGVGISWLLCLIPQFAFGFGFMNVIFIEEFKLLEGNAYTPLSMRIAGNSLVYMAVCGVVYFIALLALERTSVEKSFLSGRFSTRRVARKLRPVMGKQHDSEAEIDEDVRAEMDRVANGGANRDVIKVENLSKLYPISNGVKMAVKSTSLGIPRGECFGLLGINGAGKSSTLAILTGQLPATTGSVRLCGFDINKNPEDIHRLVGYCPQFDPLFSTLTGREHLMLYAAIKGISRDKRHAAAEEKIDEMGLRQYCDKPTGGYSVGNKRRLSVAVAMIGNPQIVFLDEPSTGMDPMARRFMWNVIMRIVTENKECAMIMTTHSMEECEALCQRIGIMVGGRLRCLGSSQHLKTRFGKGFQLEARVTATSSEETEAMTRTLANATGDSRQIRKDLAMLRSALAAAQASELESEIIEHGRGANIYHAFASQGAIPVRDFASWVIAFVQGNVLGAKLRERQSFKMRFEFPQQEGETLAQMFGLIERERESVGIGEYALSQTSLEQVFNGFAAKQEEEQRPAAGIS